MKSTFFRFSLRFLCRKAERNASPTTDCPPPPDARLLWSERLPLVQLPAQEARQGFVLVRHDLSAGPRDP